MDNGDSFKCTHIDPKDKNFSMRKYAYNYSESGKYGVSEERMSLVNRSLYFMYNIQTAHPQYFAAYLGCVEKEANNAMYVLQEETSSNTVKSFMKALISNQEIFKTLANTNLLRSLHTNFADILKICYQLLVMREALEIDELFYMSLLDIDLGDNIGAFVPIITDYRYFVERRDKIETIVSMFVYTWNELNNRGLKATLGKIKLTNVTKLRNHKTIFARNMGNYLIAYVMYAMVENLLPEIKTIDLPF